MPKKDIKAQQDKKKQIVKAYAKLNKDNRRRPTMEELVAKGFTKDSIKHHFSSLGKLEEAAREASPDSFYDVEIENIISDKVVKDLRKVIKKHKRFVVTTAVTGCLVDDNFYSSIKTYCKTNDALMLVLVASDPATNKPGNKGGYGSVDAKLAQEAIVFEDTELNTNLFISTIKLSAKHIDPTTGLDRIGQRDGSFIFASPKQRLQMVATSNIKLPHALMTTGAITQSNYRTDMYMSERTAYIAEHDHVMGAIIVEIENDVEYHYRQIQASKLDGSFFDLGKRYTPTEVLEEKPVAMVLGDWHSGETDPMVQKCTEEMIKAFSPQTVVLHDAFNGLSVNHHEDGHLLQRAIRYKQGQTSLEEEIRVLARDLCWFANQVDQVIVVKSNHDEFLSKHYLQKAKYALDPQNHQYSLGLAMAMMQGTDPLMYGVTTATNLNWNPALLQKILWLPRDQDFKIGGVELGAHGDKGPNGSRGSIRSMEKSFGNSVTGHSHTPGILRGAWAVGTSSLLKLDYNQGPSSWMQTHCLVYRDGSRQLLNMINGKWKL